MIRSIQFTLDGRSDYITRRDENEQFINPELVQCVQNRTFEFNDKINILFGPNGCGKSTILKAVAGYTMCGSGNTLDGYTGNQKFTPLEIGGFRFERPKKDYNDLLIAVEKSMCNKAIVDWDGNPVYNHDFENRAGGFSLGDLQGSFLDDVHSEVGYIMSKDSMSSGSKEMYFLVSIFNMIKSLKQRENYFSPIPHCNDVWQECYDLQREYLEKHCFNTNGKWTILLDEIDKSLDINNLVLLYSNVLPHLCDELNVQIIMVSHSPLVMSSLIQNNKEAYNVISMDDEYTSRVRQSLKGITF